MNTTTQRLRVLLRWLSVALTCAAATSSSNAGPPPKLMPLDRIMWHSVFSADGSYGGAISDVLADLPSGRILYLAVRPNELFRSPRAIPPGACERMPDGRFRCRLTLAQWLDAPTLDGTHSRLERVVDGQLDEVAFAEPAWAPPPPHRTHGLVVVAPPPGRPPAPEFVSLAQLKGMSVASVRGPDLGSVTGYLVDWAQRRVTHALLGDPHATSTQFAVPVVRLMPRIGEGKSLYVDLDQTAFQSAPLLTASGTQWQRNPGAIFRYEPHNRLATNR